MAPELDPPRGVCAQGWGSPDGPRFAPFRGCSRTRAREGPDAILVPEQHVPSPKAVRALGGGE